MEPSKEQQAQQAKQLTELLKQYGITGRVTAVTAREHKDIERLFPD